MMQDDEKYMYFHSNQLISVITPLVVFLGLHSFQKENDEFKK